jgi:hypothetical protein
MVSTISMEVNTLKDVLVMLLEGYKTAVRQPYSTVLLLSAACAANAQEADPTLTFEVASIKVCR